MIGTAWHCTVCGYIHHGAQPPEMCPICGAGPKEFEPYTPATEDRAEPASARRWRCTVCNYIHEGSAPPENCPVCGAGAEQFEPWAEHEQAAASSACVRVVVLGAGIAGLAAAEAMRGAAPEAPVTLVSKETELPYYRLNLTRYLAGEVRRDELPIHPAEWYGQQRIELRRGVEAVGMDLEHKSVELTDGSRLAFDKLILACGAHPFVPPVPGAQLGGVVSLRASADADRILDAARSGARCVIIGGGLLGLETAAGLARHKVDVTVLESFGHLMPTQLDARAGALLAAHLNGLGVKFRMAARVKELAGDRRVARVVFEDGAAAPADLVVLASGVRSNTYLARQAGLNVHKGVVVNDQLRTGHADVFAAGDVAEHRGVLYGNWFVAQYQGRIAGLNAVGVTTLFAGVPRSHTLKVCGLDTFSIGQFTPLDGSYGIFSDEPAGGYRSFVFRDGLLVGSNLVGDASLARAVRKAIQEKTDFSEVLARQPSAARIAETMGK